MPIFDFHCTDCGKTFELLIRSSAAPACPGCASQRLEKQVSLVARQGSTAGIVASARRQAAREGHFSNYSASERPRKS